jgi:hypothetical protein
MPAPLLLSLALLPQAPTLDLTDLTLGTSTQAGVVEHLGLVPGHSVRFSAAGPAGAVAVLMGSLPGAPPAPLGSGAIALDPSSAFLIGAAALDAAGGAQLDLALPTGMPVDAELVTQAVVLAASGPEPTNALTHRVTVLAPVVLDSGLKSVHPLSYLGGVELVTDPIQWQQFWSLHFPFAGGPPLPAVDFSRDCVIASFSGFVLTSGYVFVVDQLVPTPGGLNLVQTLYTPGPGCGTLFTEQRPYSFLVVDRVAAVASITATTTITLGTPCP